VSIFLDGTLALKSAVARLLINAPYLSRLVWDKRYSTVKRRTWMPRQYSSSRWRTRLILFMIFGSTTASKPIGNTPLNC
jgi:hypothetical protein